MDEQTKLPESREPELTQEPAQTCGGCGQAQEARV